MPRRARWTQEDPTHAAPPEEAPKRHSRSCWLGRPQWPSSSFQPCGENRAWYAESRGRETRNCPRLGRRSCITRRLFCTTSVQDKRPTGLQAKSSLASAHTVHRVERPERIWSQKAPGSGQPTGHPSGGTQARSSPGVKQSKPQPKGHTQALIQAGRVSERGFSLLTKI